MEEKIGWIELLRSFAVFTISKLVLDLALNKRSKTQTINNS